MDLNCISETDQATLAYYRQIVTDLMASTIERKRARRQILEALARTLSQETHLQLLMDPLILEEPHVTLFTVV